MAADPQDLFTIQYEAMVKHVYQLMDPTPLETVNTVRNVTGNQVRWPVLGSVSAVQKARHAEVVAQEPAHDTVTATMEDWYVPIWTDRLDELKSNVDYQRAYVRASAGAAIRKQREILISAMTTGGSTGAQALLGTGGGDTDGMTLVKVGYVAAHMDSKNIPQEGRYALIDSLSFQQLMLKESFVHADWVGDPMLPNAPRRRFWNGFLWVPVTDLKLSASSTATYCLFYHRDSVGAGVGQDIRAEINYVPERVAHLINHTLSFASAVIDSSGCFLVPVLTTQALTTG